MGSPGLNFIKRLLQIVECASAAGAGNIFGLGESSSGCLQQILFKFLYFSPGELSFIASGAIGSIGSGSTIGSSSTIGSNKIAGELEVIYLFVQQVRTKVAGGLYYKLLPVLYAVGEEGYSYAVTQLCIYLHFMQVCLAYKVLLGLIPLLYYVACNYLVYRVFCEGYPYCVANALC